MTYCTAKTLLRRYRWDVHAVMDQFEQATKFLESMASSSPSAAAAAAAESSGAGGSSKGKAKGGGGGGSFTCNVCFDSCALSQAISLACHHNFCHDCVKTQFQGKAGRQGTARGEAGHMR